MAKLENFRLKVFRTVAEHLNFRRAAEHLFLTQPAVTLQIKALEEELGTRLFDRLGGKISLTRQGVALLGHAKKLAIIAAEAEEEAGAGEDEVSGELSLGVSTTIAQYVLPRLIGAFLVEHPRIRLSLHSGNTEDVVSRLLTEKVMVGLIEGPARHSDVHVEPFMQDELVLIARADSEDERMSREQFLSAKVLMREQGSGSRRVVETALHKAGIRLKAVREVMYLDSTEAIKSAVEVGLGIGFVSRWAISKELELRLLKIVEVAGLRIARNFSLVTRGGPVPHAAANAFRQFALERAKILSASPRVKPRAPKRRR